MMQLASLLGAALILAAYGAHQAGRMSRDSLLYHSLHAVGGLVLCVVAVDASQAGFVVLEGVWTAISFGAFVRTARRRAGRAG